MKNKSRIILSIIFAFFITSILVGCLSEKSLSEELKNSGIPLIEINTEGVAITSKKKWIDGKLSLTDYDDEENSLDEIPMKIKGRGNTSWIQPKKAYTVKFDDDYEILKMHEDKKWVLIANYSDKTLLRNYWVSYIGNNIFKNMR